MPIGFEGPSEGSYDQADEDFADQPRPATGGTGGEGPGQS
jgi:hypothetical protein